MTAPLNGNPKTSPISRLRWRPSDPCLSVFSCATSLTAYRPPAIAAPADPSRTPGGPDQLVFSTAARRRSAIWQISAHEDAFSAESGKDHGSGGGRAGDGNRPISYRCWDESNHVVLVFRRSIRPAHAHVPAPNCWHLQAIFPSVGFCIRSPRQCSVRLVRGCREG